MENLLDNEFLNFLLSFFFGNFAWIFFGLSFLALSFFGISKKSLKVYPTLETNFWRMLRSKLHLLHGEGTFQKYVARRKIPCPLVVVGNKFATVGKAILVSRSRLSQIKDSHIN